MSGVRIRQKDCIDCGEKISREAKRCPHCTSYQDGSSGFHSRTGQLIILIAVGVSAYAAYQASEATRLSTEGHLSPTLTRLELRSTDLSFDVHNTGNLRAHLKGIAIRGKGYLAKPRSNNTVDEQRDAYSTIEFDFGQAEKRIEARDSITAHVPLQSVTAVSIDGAYKSMDRNAVLATFTSETSRATSECTISMSFIDPHAVVGSRFAISPTIDCQIVADLILRMRSLAVEPTVSRISEGKRQP